MQVESVGCRLRLGGPRRRRVRRRARAPPGLQGSLHRPRTRPGGPVARPVAAAECSPRLSAAAEVTARSAAPAIRLCTDVPTQQLNRCPARTAGKPSYACVETTQVPSASASSMRCAAVKTRNASIRRHVQRGPRSRGARRMRRRWTGRVRLHRLENSAAALRHRRRTADPVQSPPDPPSRAGIYRADLTRLPCRAEWSSPSRSSSG